MRPNSCAVTLARLGFSPLNRSKDSSGEITFRPASLTEAKALAALRVRVMQPSLTAVGRFDPQRARASVLSDFDPNATWVIQSDGACAGFFILRHKGDHLYLDHLYVDLAFQGFGLGRAVISHVQEVARSHSKPIRLVALSQSPANRFYVSCGFRKVSLDGVDNHYEWSAGP